MGAAACGGRGVKGRAAVSGERPMAKMASCQTALAPLSKPLMSRLGAPVCQGTSVCALSVRSPLGRLLPAQDRSTTLIDSQSFGPGSTFQIEPLYGGGNRNRISGDVIFHCHLYPHFAEGMWGHQRVYDTYQDGTGRYPDGTPIPALRPLPDRKRPTLPTPTHPGFPTFMESDGTDGSCVFGKKCLPPWIPQEMQPNQDVTFMQDGTYDYRPPTENEKNAMNSDPRPGFMFAKVAPLCSAVCSMSVQSQVQNIFLSNPLRTTHLTPCLCRYHRLSP